MTTLPHKCDGEGTRKSEPAPRPGVKEKTNKGTSEVWPVVEAWAGGSQDGRWGCWKSQVVGAYGQVWHAISVTACR